MAEFKSLDEATFNRVVAKPDKAKPFAVSAHFDRRSGRISVRLNTGIDFSFDPKDAHGLRDAAPDDLVGVTVEGVGNSLHFPRLDADFSVAKLLEGFLGPQEWTRREARAVASRENGKRGGRPKKVATPAA